jgi:hypothetical protein
MFLPKNESRSFLRGITLEQRKKDVCGGNCKPSQSDFSKQSKCRSNGEGIQISESAHYR